MCRISFQKDGCSSFLIKCCLKNSWGPVTAKLMSPLTAGNSITQWTLLNMKSMGELTLKFLFCNFQCQFWMFYGQFLTWQKTGTIFQEETGLCYFCVSNLKLYSYHHFLKVSIKTSRKVSSKNYRIIFWTLHISANIGLYCLYIHQIKAKITWNWLM